MTTRDIIGECVSRADLNLRKTFKKNTSFIKFVSGRSITIENAVTLMQRNGAEVFPLVALFSDGIRETRKQYVTEIHIPKIAVIVRTVGTTEETRIDRVFKPVLYPIADELQSQFEAANEGYALEVTRYDLACYSGNASTSGLNNTCDAVIFKNLKLMVRNEDDCKKTEHQ